MIDNTKIIRFLKPSFQHKPRKAAAVSWLQERLTGIFSPSQYSAALSSFVT